VTGDQIGKDADLRDWIACSLRRAADFLRAVQDEDGAWRDFMLPPGRAEAWTTAYIGSRLLAAQDRHSDVAVDASIRRACGFLCNCSQSGAWSYNGQCGPDADSTAHAILFLQSAGEKLGLKHYASLARFQRDDGAFATFTDCGARPGWTRGHAEVTAVAMRAMSHVLDGGHSILVRAAQSLRAHTDGPHGKESYWWTSQNYLARELLVLAQSNPSVAAPYESARCRSHDGSSFDCALALEVDARSGVASSELASRSLELLARQRADGSWRSMPMLRITDPQAQDFDDTRFGESSVVADDRRSLTTATVAGALSVVRNSIVASRRIKTI
jgi:hypothetical protein